LTEPRPKVVVCGATGFLGQPLVKALSQTYKVVALSRSGKPVHGAAASGAWDGKSPSSLQPHLDGVEAFINLIGEPVNQRWTTEARKRILDSRVDSTEAIAEVLGEQPVAVWINGSATGYYGDTGDREVDENSRPGSDFLAEVCEVWEHTCLGPSLPSTRRVMIRTGVVLGPGGGAAAPLFKLTKWFLGGPVGGGRQYVPWISLEDEIGLICHCLSNQIRGPINAVAPQQATQGDLMKELRNALHRPWAPPAPAFAVKLVCSLIGIPPELALDSFRVRPTVALENGYKWKNPDLASAVKAALPSH